MASEPESVKRQENSHKISPTHTHTRTHTLARICSSTWLWKENVDRARPEKRIEEERANFLATCVRALISQVIVIFFFAFLLTHFFALDFANFSASFFRGVRVVRVSSLTFAFFSHSRIEAYAGSSFCCCSLPFVVRVVDLFGQQNYQQQLKLFVFWGSLNLSAFFRSRGSLWGGCLKVQ